MVKRKRDKLKASKEPPQDDGAVQSDDEDSDLEAKVPEEEEEEEFFETPDEKRVRLAKEYLGMLKETRAPEQVQEQVSRDVEEQEQRSRLQVADMSLGEPRYIKGHRMSPTCLAMTSDESTIWTGGKECDVIRWDVETGKKDLFPGALHNFDCAGHFDRVLSVCLVEKRHLVLTGGIDRVLRLWDPRAPAKSGCAQKLLGHGGAISAIAAEPDGSQVYTASADKSIKVWDLAANRTVDTLLGHVGPLCTMDLYQKGRPLTGGMDKTVRLWKVDKDTHLMFNKHQYSVDAVSVIDHERFASGSQDGSLLIWSSTSKKPVASASMGNGVWVTALACIRRSSIVFSGTVNGKLQPWCIQRGASEGNKGLKLEKCADTIQLPGSINAMVVGRSVIACAVAYEHRLGRWFRGTDYKNGIVLIPLSYREQGPA